MFSIISQVKNINIHDWLMILSHKRSHEHFLRTVKSDYTSDDFLCTSAKGTCNSLTARILECSCLLLHCDRPGTKLDGTDV